MATLTQLQTPFPWAMGVLTKDVPSRPSHGNRGHSGSTSSAGSDTIRIVDLTRHEALMKKDMSFQERYQSSEEELSPLDEDFDDSESFKSFDYGDEDDLDMDESDYDIEKVVHAYSEESDNPWREELAARVISIVFAGRPKVVEISPTPTTSPIASQHPTIDRTLAKTVHNWSRPRPFLQNNRVARLSAYVPPDYTLPEEDQMSVASRPASQRSERRHSSIYSVASPPSPHFFNPLRRNSVADRTSLISEPATLGAPAVPTVPTYTPTGQPPARHSRIKSISRLGLFKTNKKERKDSLTSSSSSLALNTPPAPTRPTPRHPAALARSATTFAPPPFIRPNGKLIARAANERDTSPVWQEMVGGSRSRTYDHYGDDEMSDDDGSSIQERDPALTAKIRKRRSMLGLGY